MLGLADNYATEFYKKKKLNQRITQQLPGKNTINAQVVQKLENPLKPIKKVETMKKNQRNKTIELIYRFLPQMGLKLPIKTEEDITTIYCFFSDMEEELANSYECGGDVNRDFLDDVAHAFDDTALCDDDDYVDINELNEKLEQYASNHKQDRCKGPMQNRSV